MCRVKLPVCIYFQPTRSVFATATFVHIYFAGIALPVPVHPNHFAYQPAIRAAKNILYGAFGFHFILKKLHACKPDSVPELLRASIISLRLRSHATFNAQPLRNRASSAQTRIYVSFQPARFTLPLCYHNGT